jgi:hypothetical protein
VRRRLRPPLIIVSCVDIRRSGGGRRSQRSACPVAGNVRSADGPCRGFARVEPRRHATALVLGLLSDLPRKNCWTLAEHAGDATPDGMQHLLHRTKWDAEAVRDDVRAYVGIMSLTWAFVIRAGEGNRTRTTSLGIKWKPAVSATDLQLRQPASDPY